MLCATTNGGSSDFALLQARLVAQGASLVETSFAALSGFSETDHRDLVGTLLESALAMAAGLSPTRPAVRADDAYVVFCRRLANLAPPRTAIAARALIDQHFAPWRIVTNAPGGAGLLTGYYEPEVAGSLLQTPAFHAPLLARPDDLVTFAPGEVPNGFEPGLGAARRLSSGALVPYPSRAEIEQTFSLAHQRPLVFVRDWVEAFLIQVQGSARVILPDGKVMRIAYAGRNGHPYTSIGRILISNGDIAEGDMSLVSLKAWLREAGQDFGTAGRDLMHRNRSFVFFKHDEALAPDMGPVGGAGLSLTPLASIAVDRNLWLYGLPFWIEADMPWRSKVIEPMRRLFLAQDTGSAIVGPARADIFFGSGLDAGTRAGDIRHPARFTVLLPKSEMLFDAAK